jgi:adenylylsulfate kinase-like enzyme
MAGGAERNDIPGPGPVALGTVRLVEDAYETCVVFLLGYPGVGKRTVGSHLADLLDGVLVDNALVNMPLLTLFRWDGKFMLPKEIWKRVEPIREAVLGTIEDLAPKSNSYVFTNVLEDDDNASMGQYESIRSLARRRGSLFLSVMLDCDVEEQVRRIDAPDRVARLKGSDPEGYRRHRADTKLFQPPPAEVLHLDTTRIAPRQNAETICEMLQSRGFRPGAR